MVTSPGLSPAQEPRDDPGTRGRRPNILLIASDNHGSTDLGCFGAPDLRTPNLDRLAGQGLMLRQFNVAAPLCTPSRGAFLTGRCPLATGVKGNDNAMPRDEFTLAEALQGVGYRTALAGKWHLGSQPGEPLHHGFDEFFGFLKGTIENYEHDRFDWSAALASPYEKRMDYFVAHDLWRNGNAIAAVAGEPVDYVRPMIGTDGKSGHTFPGASLPFGMVQLSPDTNTQGWCACAGYDHNAKTILGFSHVHMSGTGIPDLGYFLFMPTVGPLNLPVGKASDG